MFVHIGINSMAQNDLKQSNNVLHPYTAFSLAFHFSIVSISACNNNQWMAHQNKKETLSLWCYLVESEDEKKKKKRMYDTDDDSSCSKKPDFFKAITYFDASNAGTPIRISDFSVNCI